MCISKYGADVFEARPVVPDDEDTRRVLEELKRGRDQLNRLILRLIILWVLGGSPFVLVRNIYGDIFSLICVIAVGIYGYRKYKSINLPPCPCCGAKDCLYPSGGGRNPFLNTYCRECHAILIK